MEKYRPARLCDVQSQQEAVQALRSCLRAGSNMPHLLFFGPAGTGKTSAILAVSRELFGPDYVKNRVKELNASDDRGIEVVRQKIKTFAQGAVSTVPSKPQSDGITYPVPAFKLIILDEADALLPDAQAALRRMMEDFSEVTRFCILCNYVSRIIDPIASRCAKFRFKPVDRDCLQSRIRHIAESENIVIQPANIASLDDVARGDLRLAITLLQTAFRAKGQDLSDEDFSTFAGVVPAASIAVLFDALTRGDFDASCRTIQSLCAKGFSALQVVAQVRDFVLSASCALSAVRRGIVCAKLATIEKRLMDRADDLLQLLDMAAAFCSPLPN